MLTGIHLEFRPMLEIQALVEPVKPMVVGKAPLHLVEQGLVL
jgi:hypothetical protein